MIHKLMQLIGNKYFHNCKDKSNNYGNNQIYAKEPAGFLGKEWDQADYNNAYKEKGKHHWKRRKIVIETSKEIKPEKGKDNKDNKA